MSNTCWRSVEWIYFKEPSDARKILIVHAKGLRRRMEQHRTKRLDFEWPFAGYCDRDAKPHRGRLALLGGWHALFGGIDAYTAESPPTHFAQLEELHSTGCQLCEHRPADEGLKKDWESHIAFEVLAHPKVLAAMPNLRVLCVEHACGPVLIGACMDAIGQLQHLEYLHLTPHPGGSPWAMSSERFHATFAPEGIKFWEEWSIVDINQRNGPRGCLRVDFFDQPRLHASLKQLDLSYWREAIEQVHVWVWPSFAKHLHKFRVLEVLDLNGVRWPERYEDAMADAMLSLPPSLCCARFNKALVLGAKSKDSKMLS